MSTRFPAAAARALAVVCLSGGLLAGCGDRTADRESHRHADGTTHSHAGDPGHDHGPDEEPQTRSFYGDAAADEGASNAATATSAHPADGTDHPAGDPHHDHSDGDHGDHGHGDDPSH